MLDIVPLKHGYDVPEVFKEMDRMMRHMWKGFPFDELAAAEPDIGWNPRLDLTETKESFEVKAELPGLEAKDIDISLDRDLLVIKGEKKHEEEVKEKQYHRLERRYGSFCRSLRLPAEVRNEKVDASFKNGVLIIKLPKTEESKKRVTHIDIK